MQIQNSSWYASIVLQVAFTNPIIHFATLLCLFFFTWLYIYFSCRVRLWKKELLMYFYMQQYVDTYFCKCGHVYMYVCIYKYMFVRTYVCMYMTCICLYTYIEVCICTYICLYVCKTWICLYTYVGACISVCTSTALYRSSSF